MDNFDLWMHTYMPTIEVSSINGEDLFSYKSIIIPRIGENIYWVNNGKNMDAIVTNVCHEIIESNVGKRCSRIYISVDNIQEM